MGKYRQGGERNDRCQKGIHSMKDKRDRIYVGTDHEQCRRCHAYRVRLRSPVRRGYCKKNLHKMEGANVGYRADKDTNECLACRAIARKAYEARRKAEGYTWRKCLELGCRCGTTRAPNDKLPYVCAKHAQAPSLWVQHKLMKLGIKNAMAARHKPIAA